MEQKPDPKNHDIPLNVVQILEEVRSRSRFMRNVLIVVVALLAISVGFNAWQNLQITDRSDKIVGSNATQAKTINNLSGTQVRMAEFEDVLRDLILCKQDPPCIAQGIKRLEEIQPVVPPTTTSTTAKPKPTTTTSKAVPKV